MKQYLRKEKPMEASNVKAMSEALKEICEWIGWTSKE